MFYSHEVLTNRKYGVSTIWLVATLGQKSALRKVSRKAILDVDVAKACETIVAPDAPMALRLQSSLLFGLTHVYSQQCGYVLTDAENARNNMRQVFKVMKEANLVEGSGNKAGPKQLMLQDDPNFVPDLDLMPFNLDNLDLNIDVNHETQATLSPHSSQYTASQHSLGGLMIPPSQSSFTGGPVGGLDLLRVGGDQGPGSQRRTDMVLEDDDLGFTIEADGTVREEEEQSKKSDRPVPVGIGGVLLYSQLHSPPRPPTNFDDGFAPIQDQYNIIGDDQSMPPSELVTAAAVRRREPKQRKPIPLDLTTTLHNRDLSRWSKEYLENMRKATKLKQPAKLAALAKQNAAHWVLGADGTFAEGVRGPLDMFSGAKLLETFFGIDPITGKKRMSDDDDSSQSDRRVRQRTDTSSGEAGRGLQDDDGFMPMMDDDTIEQGREGPTPLDDRHLSSIFPWNQSAGSRRPTDVGHPTSASYGGGPQLNLLGRRGSRLTSASPLIGRGDIGDVVDDDLQLPGSDYTMGGMNDDEQFELFGPAAQVDTQTAVQSQWQRAILGSESANFFSFLQNAIEEADQLRVDGPDLVDDDIDAPAGSIDFDILLPTYSNSNIVAAQAFLHVLALGTKNLLSAAQDQPFGPITLRAIAV